MEERRKDYPEIRERLSVIEAMQEKDLSQAEEWRGLFCKKLDKLVDVVLALPCKERVVLSDGIKVQLKFIWGIMSGLIISLLIVVSTNVAVMNELRKDIGYIKQHSYGVQDFENGKIRT